MVRGGLAALAVGSVTMELGGSELAAGMVSVVLGGGFVVVRRSS